MSFYILGSQSFKMFWTSRITAKFLSITPCANSRVQLLIVFHLNLAFQIILKKLLWTSWTSKYNLDNLSSSQKSDIKFIIFIACFPLVPNSLSTYEIHIHILINYLNFRERRIIANSSPSKDPALPHASNMRKISWDDELARWL